MQQLKQINKHLFLRFAPYLAALVLGLCLGLLVPLEPESSNQARIAYLTNLERDREQARATYLDRWEPGERILAHRE